MISTPDGAVTVKLDRKSPPPEISKQAVDPVWDRHRVDEEVCLLPKAAQVCGRRGATEATQEQVMICVVPCILDRHVMKQTTVFH